ncbi:hypothetical protein JRQ81_011013 [Phrynocephalus forsythii]|uniref:Uncharacterized protein n=1 Tax=Phrynocephalus forsythii TaxID=171643 RepID=A0A9Q1AQR9_9SAUR|nr:hypothetical protein JRQ81_011013 [Phrynocephalus forsythii]
MWAPTAPAVVPVAGLESQRSHTSPAMGTPVHSAFSGKPSSKALRSLCARRWKSLQSTFARKPWLLLRVKAGSHRITVPEHIHVNNFDYGEEEKNSLLPAPVCLLSVSNYESRQHIQC